MAPETRAAMLHVEDGSEVHGRRGARSKRMHMQRGDVNNSLLSPGFRRMTCGPIRKVVIAGSRTVSPTPEEIDAAIVKLDPAGLLWIPGEWTDVVCGMAPGADLAGKAWGEARGKHIIRCPITERMIAHHGKWLAPKMRNREMAEIGDAAIIFWDGLSSGSPDMCARMIARGKPCEVIPWQRAKRRNAT